VKHRLLSILPLLMLAVAFGSCGQSGGGGGGGGSGQPSAVELPYPPKAAEPASSPPLEQKPAGRVVRIGGPAEGIAADPETGLIAMTRKDQPLLTLVDAGSGEVRERVRLPASARHLEVAQPGGPVLVPAEDADALVQVSLPEGEIEERTGVGDFPHDATFLDGRVYTADEFSSTVTAIEDGRRVAQAPVDAQPGNIVAVGDQLGLVAVRSYTLELLDPMTLRSGGSQFTGSGPTHAAVDADGRIYVTDTRGDALSVFSSRPELKFIARVPLPGGAPLGLEVDRRRGRVWVSLTGTNQLLEFEASDQPRRLRTLPSVRQPNSLTVDESTGRVAVASASDDALQLVGP